LLGLPDAASLITPEAILTSDDKEKTLLSGEIREKRK